MEKKVFKFYSDAGHGWLAVKRAYLEELGILSQISSYSYQRGATVYLEEDCDMSTFFHAYKSKFGVRPQTTDVVSNIWTDRSPIRSYDSFNRMGY